jgi:hypothetical protein
MRRLLFTGIFLLLAGSAFSGADPVPDVNLFGVLFLFFAYVIWFNWKDILAGYSFLDEAGLIRQQISRLIVIRFAPMYVRGLAGKKGRRVGRE